MQEHTAWVPAHHRAVIARVLDGEAVVINASENLCRVFNASGTRIWELADGAHTLGQIAQSLADEYAISPDEAQENLLSFLQELQAKHMIVWSSQ